MNLNKYLVATFLISLTGCIGGTQPINFKASDAITKANYNQNKKNNGVILLDVNWGRVWSCGGYENAQLISLAFDKLPIIDASNEAVPNIVLQSPSRINPAEKFMNYAYSIPAGEYALSAFSIKAARSVAEVGFFTAERNTLFTAGKPVGGTFSVAEGETVFLGNFYLDCTYEPTLWRYYSKSKQAFQEQIIEYQHSFPYLDLSDVKFRLFKTKNFGNDYELE
ncbi:hypothetical protein LCGC14_0751770 [marine sediment metagenome]|uniref:Lipoprotein n=1 Tax=marine sediment metagenome TaxID=412755 RepID=A0A0F9SNV5_9ZZZZ|nr:hypothetical protein [Methylophaga sp.]